MVASAPGTRCSVSTLCCCFDSAGNPASANLSSTNCMPLLAPGATCFLSKTLDANQTIRCAFDIKGSANPTALVKYRGNVHWTERGTDPHFIVASAFGGTRKTRAARAESGSLGPVRRPQRARALNTPQGPRSVVRHPGQKARPFFKNVKRESAEAARKTLQSGLRRNMARAGFTNARNLARK